mgnify:CR=1 FL=1
MSSTQEFAGKVVVITGGAHNIGRALALEMAAAGAAVCINSRGSQAELASLVAEIKAAGGRAISHVGDVTDPAAVKQMVKATVEAFGRIDILVNGAVVHVVKPFVEITPEEWRKTIAVVLDGAFYCTQACIPEMLKAGGGTVINMGGAAGHLPLWRRAPTSAAKAGLVVVPINERFKTREALYQVQRTSVAALACTAGVLPSLHEYSQLYQVTSERLSRAKPNHLLMHPGPKNDGIEIATTVASGGNSIIEEQVTNGVAVRMAVLYLLAGGVEDETAA